MTKKEARIHAKKSRLHLEQHEIDVMQVAIENQFMKMNIFHISYIQTYIPLLQSKEVDPSEIVNQLKMKYLDMVISAPRIIDNELMESIEYTFDTKLTKNQFGIDEPANGNLIDPHLLDVILIPLLAFDLKGNRVGFGKGFYDRFLKKCRSNVVKIGLSFHEPINDISDIDINDIPLNYCITPKMIYAF